jgi:hypothetical protein
MDIENDGLKCLNGKDSVYFDDVEGKKYLEGRKLNEALQSIREFSQEVIEFLNVPDFYIEEQ